MYLEKHIFCSDKFVICPTWGMINHEIGLNRGGCQTQQESKRFEADTDLEKEYPLKIRRKRNPHYLDMWDKEPRTWAYYSKSWKKIDKCRKQYLKKKYHDECHWEFVVVKNEAACKLRNRTKFNRRTWLIFGDEYYEESYRRWNLG